MAKVKAKPTAKSKAIDVAKLVTAAAAADLEPSARLELLLQAWRARPIRALRELVIAVAAVATASDVKTSPALDAKAFDALDRKRSATDLGALLASFAAAPPTEMVRRFTKLARWPADPRILDAIASWLHEPPVQTASPDARAFWKLVDAYFAGTKDRGAAALLVDLEPHNRVSASTTIYLRPLIRRLQKAVASVAALEDPPDPALDRAIAAASGVVRAGVATRAESKTKRSKTEAELLADVYANPDDDAPRLVYADWLQDHGDAWGELVVLQIAAAATPPSAAAAKRIDELVAKHGQARYDGLPLIWRPTNGGRILPVRFERGFAVEGEAWLRTDHPAKGDHRWGTFERLRLHAYTEYLLEPDPAKSAVRSFLGLGAGHVATLLARRPPRLEEVGFELSSTTLPATELKLIERLEGSWLKAIRFEIDPVHLVSSARALFDGKLGRRAVALTISRERPNIPWYVTRDGTRLHLDLVKRYAPDALLRGVVAAAGATELRITERGVPVAPKLAARIVADLDASSMRLL